MDLKAVIAARRLSKAIKLIAVNRYIEMVKFEVVRVRKLLLSLTNFDVRIQKFALNDEWCVKRFRKCPIYMHFRVENEDYVMTYKYDICSKKVVRYMDLSIRDWPYEGEIRGVIYPLSLNAVDEMIKAMIEKT